MFRLISGKKFIFLIITTFLLVSSLWAKSVTGSIVYIEGYVDIYRDGKLIAWELVDTGFGIEEYDLIETGKDGILIVEIELPSKSKTSLSIKPETAFYFEMEEKNRKDQTTFQMLKGSISFKVQKLAGNETMNVQTVSTVMGVRGTNFEIASSPEGSILVLCSEGAVLCKDDSGKEYYAKPGNVVEKIPNEKLHAFTVNVEDLELYHNYWLSARDEIFRSGANVFIQGYAKQFLGFEPKFTDAFSKLIKIKTTLEKYGNNSNSSSQGELFKAKRTASLAVIKMRSTLPLFEMVFYRLKEMEGYHNEGLGITMIEKDLSSTKFFKNFSSKREHLSRQLAEVRYLFKLYKNIHRATGGGPSFL